ncbi:multidrug resistance protein fnx1 [Drechmeria coniospora]|uniref:Multidrug resistance protein fnx1 n=1 Tax=Drechmeria coniospora TaxID=98403 RepID=A0A151GQU4_DRECN|nr:multidrug resistance protein fnx1 [Drechmeria coniospora]KYK59460.1 multidrug resistance protein fnx1 [Drechmeria coniospora]
MPRSNKPPPGAAAPEPLPPIAVPVAMPGQHGNGVDLNRDLDFEAFSLLSRSLPTVGPVLEPEPSDLAMLRPVPYRSRSVVHRGRNDGPLDEDQECGREAVTDDDGAADAAPTETSPLLRPRAGSADSTAGSEPPVPPPFLNDTSPSRFWFIFSQLLLTQFIGCFDGTVMASSHPVITSYFQSANSASWLSTSFLLTSTAFQPLLGRLSDAIGRKPLFLGTLVVFALATTWCALAQTIESFIAARAFCGLGAGGSMTLGSIITSDLVPIERRGVYQSYINVIFGLGSAMGAALGGAVAEALGWRWEFGVQVPALLLCIAISAIAIPSELGIADERKSVWQALQEFDAKGSLLLTTSVSFLILGLNLGGNVLPCKQTPPLRLACLEQKLPSRIADKPRVSPLCHRLTRHLHHLFPDLSPRRDACAQTHHAAAPDSTRASQKPHLLQFHRCPAVQLYFLQHPKRPLYFQAVLLTSATSSGLRLALPSVVASLAGTSTGFAITWTRRLKWPLLTGTLAYLVGTICLCLLRRDLSPAMYFLVLVPSSLGQGFQFPGTFMAILACSAQSEQAVVTSTLILWRSLGMVLGVASSSLVVQNALVHYLHLFVRGRDSEAVIERVRASVEAIAKLDEPYREQVVRSYEAALRLTFACCIAFAALSVLLIIPVKLPRLALRKR